MYLRKGQTQYTLTMWALCGSSISVRSSAVFAGKLQGGNLLGLLQDGSL